MGCPRCGTAIEEGTCPACGFVLAAPSAPDPAASRPEPDPTTPPEAPTDIFTRMQELEREVQDPPSPPAPPTKRRHPVRNLVILGVIAAAAWYGWPVIQPLLEGSQATPRSYPPVTAPAGSQECAVHGDGPYDKVATYNQITQCGLANNVWEAYRAAGLNGGEGTVQATSPTSGETYDMKCSGNQPVLCAGGETARVVIYGGRFTVG